MEAQLVKSETSLKMKRTFQAPLARLYQAWIEPEMMNKWFHPSEDMTSVCSVDLRIGGRYEIQMNSPKGTSFKVGGVYREIIPEKKLVFTWRWLAAESEEEMLITLHFREVDEETSELTLVHEQFPNLEERDSHAGGWEGTFEQLAIALG